MGPPKEAPPPVPASDGVDAHEKNLAPNHTKAEPAKLKDFVDHILDRLRAMSGNEQKPL